MSEFARRLVFACFTVLALSACSEGAAPRPEQTGATQQALRLAVSEHSIAYDFAHLSAIPAGVAGGARVVFVGSPLEGRVLALSRFTGRNIGALPAPPGGFILPFILHSLGEGRLAVLDAGGLPQPIPFVPANPTIYEYAYSLSAQGGFSSHLVRSVTFASVPFGFAEDFLPLQDGRLLISDAVLGSIWVAAPDGSISPGIVPKSTSQKDAIPMMVFCPTMPQIVVGGVPFLFSGSAIPGVGTMAVRGGTLYFYSSCAKGIFSVPLATLSDSRLPYQRAADIRLAVPRSSAVVEELLGFTFNPFDADDRYLYAADALRLRLIRINLENGERQIVGDDPTLFNFPSSTAFLPPVLGIEPLFVVSNQQQLTTLTNAAITQDILTPPFLITKLFVTN
ncbi:MAG: hypothetical protein M3O36_02365 [Myxococcota bacterium]|nr:hypothetical protein [Myxococcota bacterium]